MSAVMAMDGSLNLSKIVSSIGYRVGPVASVSFSERELEVLALASNTTRSFLLSLLTPCMVFNRAIQVIRWDWLGMSEFNVLSHNILKGIVCAFAFYGPFIRQKPVDCLGSAQTKGSNWIPSWEGHLIVAWWIDIDMGVIKVLLHGLFFRS
jgi:hypothetical protein